MHAPSVRSTLCRVRRRVAAAVTLLAGLAGCAQATDDAPPAGDPAPSGTYVVTAVTEGGKPRQLVPGTEIRMTLSDGHLGLAAGCNHLGATYELEGDRLTVGRMGGTERGCPEPRMAQDAWLAGLFEEPATLGGDPLTLTAGDVVLTLVPREEAAPDLPLVGTRWVLDGLVTGDTVGSVPAGPEVVLTLAADSAQITGLCNGWGADVALGKGEVTWTPGMRTLMACADGARNDLDATVSALLRRTTAYTIEERTLTLTRGDAGLVFVAR